MNYVLRDYQERAVQDGLNFFRSKSKKNGYMVLPTGAGKSLVVSNIAKQLNTNVLVLQPTKELLFQNHEKFISYGYDASIYSASFDSREVGQVTFATIGSIYKQPELFKDFHYIIIDECHLASPDSNSMHKKFFDSLNVKILGLTASPFRLKSYNFPTRHSKLNFLDRMRPKIFSELVHVTQIQEMTERGYWAPLGYISKPFDRSKLKVNSTGANYTDDSIKQAMIEQDVVQQAYEMALILKKEGRKKILIFMPEISMAEELAEMLGVNAVSSKTKKKEREEYINNFKAGIDFAIINVNVLAVGFDDQRIDAIIDGKPTMSLGIYYQRYGRGVRVDLSPNPVKHDCLIVDLVGNYEMFGKIEDFVIKKNAIGKWALFCEDKQLTNTELVKDENVNLEDEIMGFGKYQGEPFRFIPKSYWRFIRDNFKRSAENEKLFNYIETIEL